MGKLYSAALCPSSGVRDSSVGKRVNPTGLWMEEAEMISPNSVIMLVLLGLLIAGIVTQISMGGGLFAGLLIVGLLLRAAMRK